MDKPTVDRFLMNLLKFTAPMIAVFFGQLALGISVEKALPVAIIALYGALADYFKKLPEMREELK